MIDYNQDFPSKFVYLPKVGEEEVFDIKEVRSIKEGDPRFHFKQRIKTTLPDGTEGTVEKNLGYHIEAELTNGKILSVSSLAAFLNVFKAHQLNDGMKVKIKHIDKGNWEVEILEKKEE